MNIEHKYKDLKKQLSCLNERLNECQQLSRIGSWNWNVKTNEVYWSDMMFELLGLQPMEENPSYALALHYVHKQDKEKYEQVLGSALNNKSSYYLENRITRKDNVTISVISRGECAVDDAGNLVKMIGTVQDVTYEKELAVGQLKSTFLENLSHEIRTPLNAILGFSELAKNQDIDLEKKEIYIEQISLSGKRLLAFLTDLMDMANIETGKHKLFFEDCCLNKIIDDLHQEFLKQNKNMDIKLTTQKELPNDRSYIKTDADKLKRVLSNFISTSFKYTKSGLINFGYILKAGHLKFHIKDTGLNISKENQKDIFDRFHLLKDNKSKYSEGGDLGIPIAKGFIELFGGKLWLEATENEGTIFFFTIPYLAGKNKSPNNNIEKKATNKRKTILLQKTI